MTGMDEPTYTCAVWYLDDYGQVCYELFETDEEAAKDAALLDGDNSIYGLQRADGTTVSAAEWTGFAEAKRNWLQKQQERWDNPPPPRPERHARDPFTGKAIRIETSEPDWLGQS